MDALTGQYGLTKIRGRVGWWVGLGQFVIGDASAFTHAFVVVGKDVVEAMPSGAQLTPLSVYTDGARAKDTVFSDLDLTDTQRAVICSAARDLIGTPYSFADYLALALDHWGIRPKWLRRYIADSKRLICSALVDHVMLQAGVHLFSDGRDPGDVTPGDLANNLISDRRPR